MPSGAQVGDRRAGDQLDCLVLEDLGFAARQLDVIAVALAENVDLLRILGVESGQLAAAADHRVGHAIDMRMV